MAAPRRHTLWLTLFAAGLLLGPALAAGDPLAAAFRKQAKASTKTVKTAVKDALKAVKLDVKTRLSQAKAGEATATEALAGALYAAADAAADLSSATLTATQQLTIDGAALSQTGGNDLGPEFQGGGGGAWDRFLLQADAQLTKTDGRIRQSLLKLVKGLEKTAAKQGGDLDVHLRMHEHDRRFLAVTPPATQALIDGGFAESGLPVDALAAGAAPHQVYLGVTVQEGAATPVLKAIGFAFGLDSVDLDVTTSKGTDNVADVSVNGFGVYGATVPLDGSSGGPVLIELLPDALDGPDDQMWLRRPSLIEADLPAILKEVKLQTKADLKFLSKSIAENLKALKQGDAAVRKDLMQGLLTSRQAALQVLDNRSARIATVELLDSFALTSAPAYADQLLDEAEGGPVPDEQIPDDLSADGQGAIAKAIARIGQRHARFLAKADKTTDKEISKIAKLSGKLGEPLAVNAFFGPPVERRAPLVSTIVATGMQAQLQPRPTDGAVVLDGSGVLPDADLVLGGLTDLGQTPTPSASEPTLPDVGPVDLGGLTPGVGGRIHEVANVGAVPLVGFLLRIGATETKQRQLIVLCTPRLVDLPDN